MSEGLTYEQGDAQEVPPVDDRIASLAWKLCQEHRRILDEFCKRAERSSILLATEAALKERINGHR